MISNPQHEIVPDKVLEQAVRAQQDTARGQPASPLIDTTKSNRVVLALLYALYRHKAVIDWTLSQVCNTTRTHPQVLHALRVGLCQHLYQKGIPKQAAADACVRYVKRKRNQREANFANAVLRRLFRDTPQTLRARARREAPEYVQLELSPELYRQWTEHFDSQTVQRLAGIMLLPAPITVRGTLTAHASTAHPPGCKRIASPPWLKQVSIFQCTQPAVFFGSEALASGDYHVQDSSTLLAPKLLRPQAGERIADLCCAPGGKALTLAEMGSPTTSIVCADRSLQRLMLVPPQSARHHLLRVAADAAAPPFPHCFFNGVLIDVPCSNTGVIRRRPDVRWTFSRKKLGELTAIQCTILTAAAQYVKPGGRLVYSTCSIEPEENKQQVSRFLETNSCFVLAEEQQLMPEKTHDGAYAALLHRQTV